MAKCYAKTIIVQRVCQSNMVHGVSIVTAVIDQKSQEEIYE